MDSANFRRRVYFLRVARIVVFFFLGLLGLLLFPMPEPKINPLLAVLTVIVTVAIRQLPDNLIVWLKNKALFYLDDPRAIRLIWQDAERRREFWHTAALAFVQTLLFPTVFLTLETRISSPAISVVITAILFAGYLNIFDRFLGVHRPRPIEDFFFHAYGAVLYISLFYVTGLLWPIFAAMLLNNILASLKSIHLREVILQHQNDDSNSLTQIFYRYFDHQVKVEKRWPLGEAQKHSQNLADIYPGLIITHQYEI